MQYLTLIPGSLIMLVALTSCDSSGDNQNPDGTVQGTVSQPTDSTPANDASPTEPPISEPPFSQGPTDPFPQFADQRLIRIGLGANGQELNDDTGAHESASLTRISDDGRYVAFTTRATNVLDDGLNGPLSVFLRDTLTNEVRRITKGANGEPPNNDSTLVDMTPDGRYIVFNSAATNVVAPETGGPGQVYRYDTQTGETLLVSRNIFGEPCNDTCVGGQISNDGNTVVFRSFASNFIESSSSSFDVIRVNVPNFSIESITARNYPALGPAFHQMTDDGRFVLLSFADSETTLVHELDTNEASFIDTELSATVRRSARSISADGRFMAYTNRSGQVFRLNMNTGESVIVDSEPLSSSLSAPAISPNGRFVAYERRLTADNFNTREVYLSDLQSGTTQKISTSFAGSPASDNSGDPRFSRNGQYVVFYSTENNLVSDDNNFKQDVFLYRVSE